jgi:(1->4)-alpha-D-glucan 1-alpha-D-glucosylmutase
MKEYKPTNTYRLQLTAHFGFDKMCILVPFLKKMGVDLVYTSPYFQTPKSSANPYEITSSSHIDKRYGGLDAFERFLKVLKRYKMGHMMDVVANHMASSPENPWFFDVLKKGAGSKYYCYFDLNLLSANEKIVLPYLSRSLKVSIEKGDVVVDRQNALLVVGQRKLPLKKGTKDFKITKLLKEQFYALVDYHKANQRVNFRRFFDIHELIGLNMHDDVVFQDYHQKIFSWFKKGYVQGFRIDHPDGLREPKKYFVELKKQCPGAYIVAEKILQPNESLPSDWEIDGSVGYDYLNTLNALFVDTQAEEKFSVIYKRYCGTKQSPHDLLISLKIRYCKHYLASEMHIFTKSIMKKANLRCSLEVFKSALIQFICHISVYRSYVKPLGSTSSDDEALIRRAAGSLKLSLKRFFTGPFLSPRFRLDLLRLQEIMPAVFAKGFEDTFLYRYLRLSSLNEVGSTPTVFGLSKSEFIDVCSNHVAHQPYTMTTSSTHDTKRSEDVRMRIHTLSQMPESFDAWLKKAQLLLDPLIKRVATIDKNLLYLFLQTLLGVWPEKIKGQSYRDSLIQRVEQYLIKASREAKKYTDWIHVKKEYEEGISRFVKGALDPKLSIAFLRHLEEFVGVTSLIGAKSSISALLIRLCSCGVFDLYQGQECFKFNLVDPDNRGEVQFKKSNRVLDEVQKRFTESSNRTRLVERWYKSPLNNRFRLWMISTLLQFRSTYRDLFIHGKIQELKIEGRSHRAVLAFMRSYKSESLIVVAPLFCNEIKDSSVEIVIPRTLSGLDLLTGEGVAFEKGQRLEFSHKTMVKCLYFKK